MFTSFSNLKKVFSSLTECYNQLVKSYSHIVWKLKIGKWLPRNMTDPTFIWTQTFFREEPLFLSPVDNILKNSDI